TTGTVRQYSSTTNVLVRFTSIDTQVDSNVNAFNELGGSQFFQQGNGFVDGVLFGTVNFFANNAHTLGKFCHCLNPPLPGPWNERSLRCNVLLHPDRHRSYPALWSWRFLAAGQQSP